MRSRREKLAGRCHFIFPWEGTWNPPRLGRSELCCALLSWILLLHLCFPSSLAQLLKLLSRPPEQTWILGRIIILAACIPRAASRKALERSIPPRAIWPARASALKPPPPRSPLGKFLSGQGQDTSAGLCEGSLCINGVGRGCGACHWKRARQGWDLGGKKLGIQRLPVQPGMPSALNPCWLVPTCCRKSVQEQRQTSSSLSHSLSHPGPHLSHLFPHCSQAPHRRPHHSCHQTGLERGHQLLNLNTKGKASLK